MKKIKISTHYLIIIICVFILVIAGSIFVYHTYLLPEHFRQNQSQGGSPVPRFTQDSGSLCNSGAASPRVPIPVDTSIPIQDPVPGIRYYLNENDSGRTVELGTGDIFEIDLAYAPGQPFYWLVQISGCGLELMNDGKYSRGGDFWNVTGYYRARYRAVSPGTSIIDGKYVLNPDEAGGRRFNLTVIVK